MKPPLIQYTLRNVPQRVDERLREVAAKEGASLNTVAIEALSRALGLAEPPVVHHDLDDLAGTWVRDAKAEKVLGAMDRIETEIWR